MGDQKASNEFYRVFRVLRLGRQKLCEVQWAHGRRKYGPKWAGMHPAIELCEELIDACNYSEMDRRLRWMRVPLRLLAWWSIWIVRKLQREGVNLESWDESTKA